MIKTDCSVDTYKENLAKAYLPNNSSEDMESLLNYFSIYVSDSIAKRHPVPFEALEALKHVQGSLDQAKIIGNKRESQANWQNNKPQYLVVGVIIFLVGAIIWHYLSPFLPKI
ncbi:hypothetical protein ACF8CX_03860 [Vibrio mimicus]